MKTQVLEAIGETELQYSFQIAEALSANDRLKYYFSLLQMAASHADELIGETSWEVDNLSALIADVELDRKGIPVLLKQYLKLGGELVSFHVDRAFSDSVDGLIVVDLRKTDARVLEFYMGKDEAKRYLETNAELHRFELKVAVFDPESSR